MTVQCHRVCHLSRPALPEAAGFRFAEFYQASWVHINQNGKSNDPGNSDLIGDVHYVLEKNYSIYYNDGVYFTAHIFNQRYTRDYFRFSFFDSSGYIKEIRKYDYRLRPLSHEFYRRKDADTFRKLVFSDDSLSGHTQQIDESGFAEEKNILYRYEYDQQGNWIKRIEFRDSIACHVVERTIGYFEN